MSQVHSPFKFLDSYQQADADVFFGREKETRDLYGALSGVKHLLVYGPSGSGKTSLIECGLRNQFSDADWYAISIRKGADINTSVFAGINNALHEKMEMDPVTKMPVDTQIEFAQAVEKLFAERYQPVYLLFDQFEELLISGQTDEKNTFFTLLNKLIRNKLPCRIILIMREEFIGHLSEFEPLCPSIFQHRFRVEKMGRKNVEEVIYHILEAPRYRAYFNVDDSRKLAESILSKLPDKRMEIELAHVQVFLGELWERALTTTKDNELPVLSAGLIHDDDDLERILESFLKKQMNELDESYGENVPLELLAAMITDKFTKLQLSEAAIEEDLQHKKVLSKKPISGLLKDLEQRRIIRTLKVGDETQYEISHDLLALVVGQNLTEDMKMREKAGDIYKVYGERQGLFTQDDIDYLRPFEQNLSYPPDLRTRIDESIAAIKKQHEEELTKTRKRLRTVYGLLGGALLALIAAAYLGFTAYKAKDEAEKQTNIARANYLVSEAKSIEKADPTIALGLIQASLNYNNDSLVKNEENRIYTENLFYKIVTKHSGSAKYLAFSPDGKTFLAMWMDNGSIITRLCYINGKIIKEFRDSINSTVFSVAAPIQFSPDGKYFLYTSGDTTAYLRDLNGSVVEKFDAPEHISSVAFSPTGDTILIGTSYKKVGLFNRNGNFINSFDCRFATSGLFSAIFSPDGKTILTGVGGSPFLFISRKTYYETQRSEEEYDEKNKTSITHISEATLWDLKGKMLTEFKGHYWDITSIAFSPDGKTILTGATDSMAKLWNLQGSIITTFKGHSDEITSAVFLPDGKTILTGSWDKTAALWDIHGNLIGELKGHEDGVTSVSFSKDSNTILTAGNDGTVRVWHMKGNIIQEFKGHSADINSISFSPTGDTILTCADDSTIKLWSLNGHMIKELKGTPYYHAIFSPDGKKILVKISKDRAQLWDVVGNRIQNFNFGEDINSLAFSPDGKTILISSSDMNATAKLWDLDGNLSQDLGKFSNNSKDLFLLDGEEILSAGNYLSFLDLKGNLINQVKGSQFDDVLISPDGKTILTNSDDSIARLLDLNGAIIREFKGHEGSVSSVAFSKDGKNIITGAFDSTARLWDLDGNMIRMFRCPSEVFATEISPDEKTILTKNRQVIRLWDPKGLLKQQFKQDENTNLHVIFSPDGKTVLTYVESPYNNPENDIPKLWAVVMNLDDFIISDTIEPLSAEQKKQYGIK